MMEYFFGSWRYCLGCCLKQTKLSEQHLCENCAKILQTCEICIQPRAMTTPKCECQKYLEDSVCILCKKRHRATVFSPMWDDEVCIDCVKILSVCKICSSQLRFGQKCFCFVEKKETFESKRTRKFSGGFMFHPLNGRFDFDIASNDDNIYTLNTVCNITPAIEQCLRKEFDLKVKDKKTQNEALELLANETLLDILTLQTLLRV